MASAARTRPSAASNRARASSGVSCGQLGYQGRLQFAAAALQQSVGRFGVRQAGQLADDAVGARPQLVVGRPQVHHQVAERLAQPDHRPGGERVQHQLGRRARLEPRRAAQDFRTDDGRDGQIDVRDQLRVGVARQADGERPHAAGVGDGPEHVGRAAARGDADQHVVADRGSGQRGRVRRTPGGPPPPRRLA